MNVIPPENNEKRKQKEITEAERNGRSVELWRGRQWKRRKKLETEKSTRKCSVSVAKRLVMGWIRFSEAGNKFDCIISPNAAHPIPVHVEEVTDIQIFDETPCSWMIYLLHFIQKLAL
ncbi:hypothetical protein Dimus_037169 [Dionaea muscipula]